MRRHGLWLGALASGLLVTSAPVAAAAAPVAADVEFAHMALVPDGPAKLQSVHLWSGGTPFTLHDVKATIDTSGLAGAATAKLEFAAVEKNCTAAGPVFTCAFDTLQAPEGFAGITTVSYRAADGAKAGAEGSATLKLTSRELGTTTRTAKVTVAEGVRLEVPEPAIAERSAKPGGAVTTPLAVRNGGTNPITGVDLFFFVDPWYRMTRHYANCEYGTTAVFCHFDAELKPGTSYGTSEAMGVTLRADIPAPEVVGQTYHWLTPTDNRDNIDLVRAQKPKKGTDGTLRLVARPSAVAARGVPQTDTSLGVDWQTTIISVTGSHKADLAAAGAQVRGAVGATVEAKVGVRNLGPAFVFGFPDPAAKVTVTPPAGTTVVATPAGCEKSGKAYVCTTAAMPFNPGTAVTWSFRLRIGKAGKLAGAVSVKSSQPDGSTANDTAKLVVNPPAGTTAGDGDTGGQGGGLAVTGAPTMLIFAVGGLLLAGGAAALVLSRRRSRFLA